MDFSHVNILPVNLGSKMQCNASINWLITKLSHHPILQVRCLRRRLVKDLFQTKKRNCFLESDFKRNCTQHFGHKSVVFSTEIKGISVKCWLSKSELKTPQNFLTPFSSFLYISISNFCTTCFST